MRIPRAILAGLAALAVSLTAATAAQASIIYGQAGSFDAGQEDRPLGVAIDSATGDVYVTHFFSNKFVEKFDRAGGLLSPPFGKGAESGGNRFFSGVAVNPVNEHLYVVQALPEEEAGGEAGAPKIQTYDGASGALLSQFSVAGSGSFIGSYTVVQIAADAAGNVYLPNAPNNDVQEFDPEGNVLETITGSGGDALKEPTGVAVNAAGKVYVADNGNGRMEEFSSVGAFVMALGTGVDQTTGGNVCTAASKDTCGPGSDGSQAVAVDASGGIFVGENSGAGFHVVLYSPAGEELSDFGLGAIGASELGVINTLAVSPSGLVYVADGGNNVVWIYAQQSRPSLLKVSSLAVTHTTGTLSATIDAGRADTTYRFEYGTSAAYGVSVPAPDADIGSGLSGPIVVGQQLAGLQPGATYHYRVVASNALGQAVGADQTFTTLPPQPPVVSTGQAGGVAQSSATLTGTVDARGFETGYEFDFGVDTSYGTRIFGDAGVEPGAQTFAAALQGLMPGTTYHYRVLATNVFGTVYGADQVFTTASYPSSVLAGSASPPLLSTPLLAPAGKAPVGGAVASASGARPSTAHAARHRKAGRAGKSGRRPGGYKQKGRSTGGTGHARNADRGGK